MPGIISLIIMCIGIIMKLETASIAEPLQNRQHAQNPVMLSALWRKDEVGRNERKDGGRKEGGRKGQIGRGRGRE